jgi:hypothetical protein
MHGVDKAWQSLVNASEFSSALLCNRRMQKPLLGTNKAVSVRI